MYRFLTVLFLLVLVSGCSIFSVPRIETPPIPILVPPKDPIKEDIKKEIKDKKEDIKDDTAKDLDQAKNQLQDLKKQLEAAQLIVGETKEKIKLKNKEINDLRNAEIASIIRWAFIASLILSVIAIIGGLFLWIRLLSDTGKTIAICGVIGVILSLCGMYFASYWTTIALWSGILLVIGLIIEGIRIFEKHKPAIVSMHKEEKEERIRMKLQRKKENAKTEVLEVLKDTTKKL